MKILHIGYARRSRNGRALKLDILIESVLSAQRYTGSDGKEYINAVLNVDKLYSVLEGRKPVTGINQITEDGEK